MSYGLLIAVELLAIIVCCGVLPAVVLHFLMKAFARRSAFLVKNYVGRAVPLGLGFVWPLWGIGALLLALMVRLFPDAQYEPLLGGPARLLGGGFLGWAIAIGAVFAFGLIDDLGGAGISKGFKGHLKALGHGKLTTGMIKLIGIGITALLFSRYYFMYSVWVGAHASWLIALCLLGAAIALNANFVNLCDLRPGRASKVAALMLVIGFFIGVIKSFAIGAYYNLPNLLLQLVFFLLPVLVTLRYDLRERGMLGDAGANPAGFIAGAYIAIQLSWVGLVIFFLIMLALNLLSEKFSFSRVIEKNSLLLRLDQMGRINTGEIDRKKETAD